MEQLNKLKEMLAKEVEAKELESLSNKLYTAFRDAKYTRKLSERIVEEGYKISSMIPSSKVSKEEAEAILAWIETL